MGVLQLPFGYYFLVYLNNVLRVDCMISVLLNLLSHVIWPTM